MELTEIQEAPDQLAVIAGHALTAVNVDSDSPEGSLLFSRISEVDYPPLTYDDNERPKFKDVWYGSDMSESKDQRHADAFRPAQTNNIPGGASIVSGQCISS